MSDDKKDQKKEEEKVNLAQKEYEQLKAEAEKGRQAFEQYVRTYAELENTKKRFIKEKSELAKYANTELILGLLPVIDNFDRALGSLKNNDKPSSLTIENPVFAGIELIRKQFHLFLDQQGVKPLEVVGKKFDPHQHEALLEVETDEVEEGTIIEEIQKGYFLQERLIRPAVVKVAKKPQPKIDQGGLDNG